MTDHAVTVMLIVSLASLCLGLIVGYQIGVAHNWLTPTVKRMNGQLDRAWNRIAALEHGEDDWTELGIGR